MTLEQLVTQSWVIMTEEPEKISTVTQQVRVCWLKRESVRLSAINALVPITGILQCQSCWRMQCFQCDKAGHVTLECQGNASEVVSIILLLMQVKNKMLPTTEINLNGRNCTVLVGTGEPENPEMLQTRLGQVGHRWRWASEHWGLSHEQAIVGVWPHTWVQCKAIHNSHHKIK